MPFIVQGTVIATENDIKSYLLQKFNYQDKSDSFCCFFCKDPLGFRKRHLVIKHFDLVKDVLNENTIKRILNQNSNVRNLSDVCVENDFEDDVDDLDFDEREFDEKQLSEELEYDSEVSLEEIFEGDEMFSSSEPITIANAFDFNLSKSLGDLIGKEKLKN